MRQELSQSVVMKDCPHGTNQFLKVPFPQTQLRAQCTQYEKARSRGNPETGPGDGHEKALFLGLGAHTGLHTHTCLHIHVHTHSLPLPSPYANYTLSRCSGTLFLTQPFRISVRSRSLESAVWSSAPSSHCSWFSLPCSQVGQPGVRLHVPAN